MIRRFSAALVGLVAVLLLGAAAPAGAQSGAQSGDDSGEASGPFLRHPAVSPDGSQIAFSFQGDLWTVPASGGRALRLTVHDAYESHPRWSPDGSQIAFSSDRHGNADVFFMDAAGGAPSRLTYHSAGDAVSQVTADGRVLFTTERTYVQVEREEEIYHVPTSGGTPDRLLDGLGYAPALSPGGRFIVMERGSNRTSRSDYQGPANRDLWIYDTEAETYTQITSYTGNDYSATWAGERELYFISDRDGTRNLYRLSLGADGTPQGSPEALTSFSGDGVRAVSASADGSTVAFERQTDVYTLDVGAGASPKRLDVQVPEDDRRVPTERMTLSKDARETAVSPDGSQIAYVVRGEIFVTEAETDEPQSNRATQHAYRDRDVVWIDESSLLFTSDRDGQYDVYRLDATDDEADTLFESLQQRVTRLTETEVDERNLVLSPDRASVAFTRGLGSLVTASVTDDGLQNERVLLDGWAPPEDVTWSPDGDWLAYSRSNLNFNEEIYVLAADGSGDPVNVSQHPRTDRQPVWSPDGSKLGFASERSASGFDVWFAWLKESDWEKTQREWDELQEEDDASDDDGDTPPDVQIDVEGIYQRLHRVTAMPGNEGEIAIGPDGQTFYFVAGMQDWTGSYQLEQDLYSIRWDRSERKRLTEGGIEPSNVRLGPTGEALFFLRKGGMITRLPLSSGSMENLPFAARMTVDRDAERMQIFEEAWRTIDNRFYDPDYHGVDWTALRAKYRPWVQQASTTRDVADVMNLMLGEVNASHMGFYPASLFGKDDGGVQTGLLGVELDPVDDGVRVARVVPHSPAARTDSRLRVGDVVTAVNGTAVDDAPNVYALLEDTAGERVLLSVRGSDGDERSVRIRPTDDLDDALYREWVEDRRELTDEYSDGRLGYIHIEGMNWESFERFERQLSAYAGDKEGLLVDVRYNGGGWTTDYLMTVLTVRRHAYTVPRGAAGDLSNHEQFREHYPFGERLPYAAWTKPVAALCNQNSYSNAEIFSHAFKQFDLGPLVGTPTFGAVISTGANRLIDGSLVRVPFRGWYVYETDANMEGTPATPDVIVENAPDARASGNDAQLRRAVNELLQQVDGTEASASRSGETSGSGR